jgi:hypothetical protein
MRTAAIQSGVVRDIEEWNLANPPTPRADGLARVPCPAWVEVGCLYDGATWTNADGSGPSDDQRALDRKTWPCLDFIARFTPDERAAVRTYAPDLMEMLLAAHEIESDNPLTIYGLSALVAGNIITEERKAQLLA